MEENAHYCAIRVKANRKKFTRALAHETELTLTKRSWVHMKKQIIVELFVPVPIFTPLFIFIYGCIQRNTPRWIFDLLPPWRSFITYIHYNEVISHRNSIISVRNYLHGQKQRIVCIWYRSVHLTSIMRKQISTSISTTHGLIIDTTTSPPQITPNYSSKTQRVIETNSLKPSGSLSLINLRVPMPWPVHQNRLMTWTTSDSRFRDSDSNFGNLWHPARCNLRPIQPTRKSRLRLWNYGYAITLGPRNFLKIRGPKISGDQNSHVILGPAENACADSHVDAFGYSVKKTKGKLVSVIGISLRAVGVYEKARDCA